MSARAGAGRRRAKEGEDGAEGLCGESSGRIKMTPGLQRGDGARVDGGMVQMSSVAAVSGLTPF